MALPNAATVTPHANAQELAYATLRGWILHGPLQPGEMLRDAEIATLLGVSRTPVREALIRLSEQGLVETARGRGTRVTYLGLERAPHLFAVGAVLDGYAAEVAAGRLTDEDQATLRRLLSEMETTDDPRRLSALDQEFHHVYYASAGNPVLVELLDIIDEELVRIERHAWSHGAVQQGAHAEHQALAAALERGDGPAAGEAARENWRRSWDRIERLLSSRDDDA